MLSFLGAVRQTVRMVDDTPSESRAESRARITTEIMDAARRQLAEVGAAALSLRSIAREVGMVSSAVYRYVESRDDLLTRLIIEAYDALGATAEHAAAGAHDSDLDRWVATASAIRGWSLDHPHEHLLLFGSPVPGYAAPQDTIVPGTRVTFALVSIVRDAVAANRLAPTTDQTELSGGLRTDLERLTETIETAVPAETVLSFLIGWTQMFGLIGFELTNQTRNLTEHDAELFAAAARRTGASIGLGSIRS